MRYHCNVARFSAVILAATFVVLLFRSGAANAQEPTGDPAPADKSTAPAPKVETPAAVLPSPTTAPVSIRLRQLERRVQALKERAWRAKARVGMLKEAVLGGGVGARASIVHENKMGSSFRLIRLVYALDGAQMFTRTDQTGALHKQKKFDVLTGPLAPGSHTITVMAEYRGHGYGVFKYMNKYKFKVRASHTFTASEGKAVNIRVHAHEKGGATTPLEERPAIDFKVQASGAKGSKE